MGAYGITTREEKGNVKNTRFISTLRAILNLPINDIVMVKPFVDFAYQNTGKLAYTEDGDVRNTRMQFNIASRNSTTLGRGSFISAQGATFIPYAEIFAGYEFNEIDLKSQKAKSSNIDHEFHTIDVYSVSEPKHFFGYLKAGFIVKNKIISAGINYQCSKQFIEKVSHKVSFDLRFQVV